MQIINRKTGKLAGREKAVESEMAQVKEILASFALFLDFFFFFYLCESRRMRIEVERGKQSEKKK